MPATTTHRHTNIAPASHDQPGRSAAIPATGTPAPARRRDCITAKPSHIVRNQWSTAIGHSAERARPSTASPTCRCRRAAARSPRRARRRTSRATRGTATCPTSAAARVAILRTRRRRSRLFLLVAVGRARDDRRLGEVAGRAAATVVAHSSVVARHGFSAGSPRRALRTTFHRNTSWKTPRATAAPRHVARSSAASAAASSYCRPASYRRRFTPMMPIRNIGRKIAFMPRTSPRSAPGRAVRPAAGR